MLIYKNNFSLHKYLICNNGYIQYKNRSIYFEGWVRCGILMVVQLLEFLHEIPITPKEYTVLFDMILNGILRPSLAPMLGDLAINDM